jgi:predicted adenylyl cyclase CyaB
MEIETRAFINNAEKMEIKIKSLGASFLEKIRIIDDWYCINSAKDYSEIKMDKPGSYGLRIRTTFAEDKKKFEINCKVLEKEFDHCAFNEYETEIKDLAEMEKILESIGFKKFCSVDKKRTSYKLMNTTINIEEINGFKPAIEIEIIDDKEIEKHQDNIKNIMKSLEIKDGDIIEKSITRLYMDKYSKF